MASMIIADPLHTLLTVNHLFCFLFVLSASFGLATWDSVEAQQRVPWTTSHVEGTPEPAKPYHIARVYPKLTFSNPVELRPIPKTNQMLLLQVDGKLFVFDDDQECDEAQLILDLGRDLEQMRAYGFGLHPDFEANRQLFIVYSRDTRFVADAARLSRFIVPHEAPYEIDRASEEVLVTWNSGGHNGSTVQFDDEG